MAINVALAAFAGGILVLSLLSTFLQRASLPGPLLALILGIAIGPAALDVLRIGDFGVEQGSLLEQACRLTLGVGLAGVALRLPHGYWRANLRWVTVMLTLGMAIMFLVATGMLWAVAGVPVLTALLLGAILTPTDPIVSTPIVTGSQARRLVPKRVRLNISSESGINDGLGYLFVLLPVLLLSGSGDAWQQLLTRVLLWEVLGSAVFGAAAGWALAKLFTAAQRRGLMEKSSYLGFIIPAAFLVLGAGALLGTDAVLAVFVAAAVFGQLIPQQSEDEERQVDDVVNRLFILPVFILLGMALPIQEWSKLDARVVVAILLAVVVRRTRRSLGASIPC